MSVDRVLRGHVRGERTKKGVVGAVTRVAIVLPGLHRVRRGAEIAFQALGAALSEIPGVEVTLFGSGEARADTAYRFVSVPSIDRTRLEWLPEIPLLRSEYRYEEMTFLPGLLRRYRPDDFDVTIACSLPTNWFLTRRGRAGRPAHIYVTNNGADSPAGLGFESRFFSCDGLVCTNPMYVDETANDNWAQALIPNGVDRSSFRPGPGARKALGLPDDVPLVLMASALYPSKRVIDGMRAVAALPGVHLVVAGAGPLGDELHEYANAHLPGRFHRCDVDHSLMPALYRSADAFLHMTYLEPFGNVYVEAAATGVPIVAHDSPSTRWILGDEHHLVETLHHELVVDALASALTPTASEAAVAGADAFGRRYDWSTIAAQYRELIDRIRPDLSSSGLAPTG